jgi:HAMP domain-containing protein
MAGKVVLDVLVGLGMALGAAAFVLKYLVERAQRRHRRHGH